MNRDGVNRLAAGGFTPLTAMVLAARGFDTAQEAREFLRTDSVLLDPFLMKDLDKAAQRVKLALERDERIVVYGDYDVDGITATCLLTDYLRSRGADCLWYIPGRLEEGYGLNPMALHHLQSQGADLIITVDCGITAVEEAKLCYDLGMELVITDHHECKKQLPAACAVVDPHRPDCTYPHKNLSGVGIAFKLAAALEGSQERILQRYADMVCLGTVADVMPLVGEMRVFVDKGLQALRQPRRPGLVKLMEETGCDPAALNASSIGYILAPRINAAGRMERIELSVELFLTRDENRAADTARALCQLNRQRQLVESGIYEQAVAMLPHSAPPDAIVLADPGWHQGVVGIVASRLAEEYCCPTFLICLDGDKGKASSRSFGGFNLFACLTELSPLLQTYGGHELAAGFTISKENIPVFREKITQKARDFYEDAGPRTILDIDCVIPPELLTLEQVESLQVLEPCGTGCPKPVFCLENLRIERLMPVGNGRHLRLQLRHGVQSIPAIAFSCTAESLSVREGDLVDVACALQINDFRGIRSVQIQLMDIRPSCPCACDPDPEAYRRLKEGLLTREQARHLLPPRKTSVDVWRYLALEGRSFTCEPCCLCRKIVRHTAKPLSLSQLLVCLDIFREAGLLRLERQHHTVSITLTPGTTKADLNQCPTMKQLQRLTEGGHYGNI